MVLILIYLIKKQYINKELFNLMEQNKLQWKYKMKKFRYGKMKKRLLEKFKIIRNLNHFVHGLKSMIIKKSMNLLFNQRLLSWVCIHWM